MRAILYTTGIFFSFFQEEIEKESAQKFSTSLDGSKLERRAIIAQRKT
jgi:hypothetical protein